MTSKLKDEADRQIKALIASGKADEEPEKLFVPQMITEEIFNQYSSLLTKRAKKALTNINTQNLIHQYNKPISGFKNYAMNFLANTLGVACLEDKVHYERCFYQVRYIGVKIKNAGSEERAVKKIFSELDSLAKKKWLKGNLVKLIKINLPYDASILVSYIVLTDEGVKHVDSQLSKSDGIYIHEGSLPKELED